MTIAYVDQPGLMDYIQANGQWVAEINGLWYTSDDTKVNALIAAFVPPAPPVPQSITQRQVRLELLNNNLLTAVENAVAAMTGTAGQEAQITWQYASAIDRNSPLITAMATQLNLTSDQIDAMFINAATL